MKKLATILVVFLGVFLLVASSSSKQMEIQQVMVNFDYTPKAKAPLGSAEMSIALVRPYYAEDMKDVNKVECFRRYQTGIEGDVNELLTAKGFTIQGPYAIKEDMTYSNKKTAHLALTISISPTLGNLSRLEKKASFAADILGGASGDNRRAYTYSGTISLGGRLELIAYEPLTNEKLWVKSVELPEQPNIEVKTVSAYYSLTPEGLLNDPGFYNPISKALESSYSSVMSKIESYIDVEEFKSLLPQIKELKARK